jgi:hypothetical protein
MRPQSVTHKISLLDTLEIKLRQHGWLAKREARVRGIRLGFIDLLADKGPRRIVIEAELTPRRVTRDVEKADAVRASELWIVVPTGHVRRAVERLLRHTGRPQTDLRVHVLTVPQAIALLDKTAMTSDCTGD